ncbi:PucR family transcriptional regulator [Hespellia stercorisuis]|uniref:Carbohydrate diacid regulator n=1 Tax=Hespellia stercorisuis DSM 15480 TaxID=1121950 RepID=A0A1M6NJZ8_9FIRM|nr:helix-turn-helix domain-containing protein [Hespellia stercorisuis]SHJ95999.1 carbohydrate diacid regulator [Hespellia stercorisuis DSM 15480]
MTDQEKLQKALDDLRSATGLDLHLNAEDSRDPEQTLSQLRQLSSAYKEKYNRDFFLQSILGEAVSRPEIDARASRFHIDAHGERRLFLIASRNVMDENFIELLKNLFPSSHKYFIVRMDGQRIVLISPCKAPGTDDAELTARTVVDTISSELMTSVQVAYSNLFSHLSDSAEAYSQTRLAIQIGRVFYPEYAVIPYNRLGIGGLIYRLPPALCENFLREVFGVNPFDALDEELLTTVSRFFQNNLNIAETARQLHMHRNTLIYRIEHIQKMTGLDIRIFEDALTFKLATMVINYLHAKKENSYE